MQYLTIFRPCTQFLYYLLASEKYFSNINNSVVSQLTLATLQQIIVLMTDPGGFY